MKLDINYIIHDIVLTVKGVKYESYPRITKVWFTQFFFPEIKYLQ